MKKLQLKEIIRGEIKKILENQSQPFEPITKPETKPETKPKRRTLTPPKHSPDTKPKASMKEDEKQIADKIINRFKKLSKTK